MALNAQALQGSWNEIKGKIRQRWGQVTDQELQKAHGSVDQLVGVIQRKTRETRPAVEEYLESREF